MVPDEPGSLFDDSDGRRAEDSTDAREAGAPGPAGAAAGTPLADRMRPRDLDEFVGQEQLLGPGKLVRQIIESGEPVSLILWGPPGSGKTTLARIMADASGADLVALSAVMAGVKEVREVAAAAGRRRRTGRRTILFLDEIHRFNKAQQDALLPFVEHGDLVLIGATTENPSFEIVSPLLSRTRVVRLEPLPREALVELLERALATPAPRGLGGAGLTIARRDLEALATFADGDARTALNALELAARIAASSDADRIGPAILKEAMQRRMPRTDKAGEGHFDLISALHKSVRSSDPDAALYWLARMLEAGEDPRYVARRLVRMATEDVGLADPGALTVATAGFDALERVGLPEAALALAEVAVHLALAPKSDALYRGWRAARAQVDAHPNAPVPMHLRNAPTDLMKRFGYGEGYEHAHESEDGLTAMRCLPDEIEDTPFYRPTSRGHESAVAERLREIRRIRADRRHDHAPPDDDTEEETG